MENGEKQTSSAGVAKATAPTKTKTNKHGVVQLNKLRHLEYRYHNGAEFDIAGCDGCEHKKLASYNGKVEIAISCCFNVPCWNDKTDAAKKTKTGANRLASDCLDKWVVDRVTERLAADSSLRFQVLAWMAAGMPLSQYENVPARFANFDEKSQLDYSSIINIAKAEETASLEIMPLVRAGIQSLTTDDSYRPTLYAYARHIGVRISFGSWRIDQAYLDLKTKPELISLLERAAETADIKYDAAETRSLKRDALIEKFTTEVILALGVPPDIETLFNALSPSVDEPIDTDDENASEQAQEEQA
jgi:hypothetical protein